MFLKGLATILFCAFLSVAGSFLINHYSSFYSGDYWFSLFLFTGLFFILNIVYAYNSDFRTFSEILLGTISVKLLILLVAIFLYSLYNKNGLFAFFIHFSLHYILFTVFEIRYLLQIIKQRQIKNNP